MIDERRMILELYTEQLMEDMIRIHDLEDSIAELMSIVKTSKSPKTIKETGMETKKQMQELNEITERATRILSKLEKLIASLDADALEVNQKFKESAHRPMFYGKKKTFGG